MRDIHYETLHPLQRQSVLPGLLRRPRLLRDILVSHISAVPTGGEIFWATYYFRDEALAEGLVLAKKRGVKVRLALEAHPRNGGANRPVLEMLRYSGNLGSDCRAVRHVLPDNLLWKRPRLHIKLYYFSHPEPHCLVGTFNPSGNEPEEPAIVAEIGDQDRGHNFMVEISDSRLVSPLRDHLYFSIPVITAPGNAYFPETTWYIYPEIQLFTSSPASGAILSARSYSPFRLAQP